MATTVINTLIEGVDSILDVSHADKSIIILRYVNRKEGTAVERVFCFVSSVSDSAERMEKTILELLENFRINTTNCHDMTFNNAANMTRELFRHNRKPRIILPYL
jgi:hypothetical protein